MAETRPHTPEINPQEAIAEVLVALGNSEPNADQLRFLTTEADKIEGGLIVDSIDARGRNEHRIPDGVRIHNIDFPDARIKGSRPVVFHLQHTFNHVDPATGISTRLDDTLAKTLLEFSTYARTLRSERFGTGATGTSSRLPSGRLPDSGRVHIDEDSYAKIKAFVETCPRMSDSYLEQKGLTKSEASAIFAALQRDGTVESTYTEGEGYLVSSRHRAETTAPTRARRQSLFTRAVNGLFSGLEEEPEKKPVVRPPAPYRSASTLWIDNTSLQPITPVVITSKESESPTPKREDYLLTERYWPKVVRYVAGQVSSAHHPKVWPQIMPNSTFASQLGKMDKEEAGKVLDDIYLKLRVDGVLQPLYAKDQRGRTVLDNYKLLKSKEEILDLYGVSEKPSKAELEKDYTFAEGDEPWREIALKPEYAHIFKVIELSDLYDAINNEARPLKNKRLTELKLTKSDRLPADEYAKIINPISKRHIDEYLARCGTTDDTGEIVEAIKLAMLDANGQLKKR